MREYKEYSEDGLREVGFSDPRRQRQTWRKGNALITESDEAYHARMAKLDAEERENALRRQAEYQARKAEAAKRAAEAEKAAAPACLPDGKYTLSDGYTCQIWQGDIYAGHGDVFASEWLGSSKKLFSLNDLENKVNAFFGSCE